MSTAQIEKYLQTAKFSISKVIKENPYIFFPILLTGFGILIRTVLFLIYPEVSSDNINQFFLICIFHTSVLAFILISPCLYCLFDNHSISKRLPLKVKARLALIEFYITNVSISLLFGFFLFDFSAMQKIIIVTIMSICIITLLYYFSWPIRRRINLKKFKSSVKAKFNKKYQVWDYLIEIIQITSPALMSFSIVDILFHRTWIINIYAPVIEGYSKFALAMCGIYIPSLLIYIFRNAISALGGFVFACIIVMIIVPKNLSLNYNWLTNNHIANFDDYQFVINKVGCDSLAINGVKLQWLKNKFCKISVPFEVISETPEWYKIKLKTVGLNKQIEHIRKKNINHIREKLYQDPVVKFVDRDTELFSKLYHQNMLVMIKNNNQKSIISEQGFSKKFNFKITVDNDKALSLGSYLYRVHDLIELEDNALLINKDHSGTILESLLIDNNDKFFHLLIHRLENAQRHGDGAISKIEDIIEYFTRIAKKNNYRKFFSELGYWKRSFFGDELVVELLHKEDKAELLLVYFTQQKFAIAIAVENPDFLLTLDDKRLQHFLYAIMKDN